MDIDFVKDRFIKGVSLLDEEDRAFLLDKIEESRWATGPTYNRGVHILMDVIQYTVESSYGSDNPNIRNQK